MEALKNKEHWEDWANKFQNNLRATTKGRTIKEIEIHYLISAIEKYAPKKDCKVLECGCGNGLNIIGVSQMFPSFKCLGFDFVQAMIDNALINKDGVEKELGRELQLSFQLGDLREPGKIAEKFDVIFTNRAIINLSSTHEQRESLKKLVKMLNPAGILMLLENSVESYANQNTLRERLGLEKRTPAEFNVFVRESDIIETLEKEGLKLVALKNLGSLHDIILYVLLPKITGEVDNYENPLVNLAKDLEISFQNNFEENHFGSFGQVNLFIFKMEVS